MFRWMRISSPIGGLMLIGGDQGLVRISFEKEGFEEVLADTGARLGEELHEGATPLLQEAARQFEEYFSGERREFELPLDRRLSSGFFAEVQTLLASIPYGRTMSYSQLAAAAGRPKAHRAAANACASNPLPFIQACHRITRSDGTFGGYRGGVEEKQYLLDFEAGRIAPAR